MTNYEANKIVLAKVKDALRADSVKLWLEPYVGSDDAPNTEILLELATKFTTKLNLPSDSIYSAVTQLQKQALLKLAQNNKFKADGIAVLQLKVSPATENRNSVEFVETTLDVNGTELSALVKEKLGTDSGFVCCCTSLLLQ